MLLITKRQIQSLEDKRIDDFVQTTFSDTRALCAYPKDDREMMALIKLQAVRAIDQYDIIITKWIFQFVVLSLNNKILLQKKYPNEIEEILKWPGRKSEWKIELLKKQLLK